MRANSFQAIVRALDAAHMPYLVAGGIAVNAHGYLRFTKDVDLVLDLSSPSLSAALAALQALGYRPTVPVSLQQLADATERERWIRDKNMQVFQLWSDEHRETPIDIFVEVPFPFDDEYSIALVKALDGIDVRFVSLETLIKMKEAAGRDQDRIDVEHLRLRLEDDHD